MRAQHFFVERPVRQAGHKLRAEIFRNAVETYCQIAPFGTARAPKTFLFAGNDRYVLESIESQVTRLGHYALLCTNCVDGLETIDNFHIDAAFVDWHLAADVSAEVLAKLGDRRIPT